MTTGSTGLRGVGAGLPNEVVEAVLSVGLGPGLGADDVSGALRIGLGEVLGEVLGEGLGEAPPPEVAGPVLIGPGLTGLMATGAALTGFTATGETATPPPAPPVDIAGPEFAGPGADADRGPDPPDDGPVSAGSGELRPARLTSEWNTGPGSPPFLGAVDAMSYCGDDVWFDGPADTGWGDCPSL